MRDERRPQWHTHNLLTIRTVLSHTQFIPLTLNSHSIASLRRVCSMRDMKQIYSVESSTSSKPLPPMLSSGSARAFCTAQRRSVQRDSIKTHISRSLHLVQHTRDARARVHSFHIAEHKWCCCCCCGVAMLMRQHCATSNILTTTHPNRRMHMLTRSQFIAFSCSYGSTQRSTCKHCTKIWYKLRYAVVCPYAVEMHCRAQRTARSHFAYTHTHSDRTAKIRIT